MSTRLTLAIQEHFEKLSPSERRLATLLVDRADDLLAYSASEMAAMAGVSKATAARLFRSLGYADFNEVKLQARQERNLAPPFQREVDTLLRDFVGRPTPFAKAERLSESSGGAQVWLKREDLAHTGAHKINNTIGQALLAKRLGKTRIIAETGAGQHGVATATACARLGLQCEVYMGAEDVRRQALNVFRMRLLGAKVNAVETGSRTLKDATNEAMRDWMGSVSDTHYIIGSVVGPHPFPMMVRDFQSVIGRECRAQSLERLGRLPDAVVASVPVCATVFGSLSGSSVGTSWIVAFCESCSACTYAAIAQRSSRSICAP